MVNAGLPKLVRRARMRDVALRAGVGLTTVSRAFADPDKVAPETRRRIELAVSDLNYRVDVTARNMRATSTGRVLIMLPDIGNSFFTLVLKGIEEVALSNRRMVLIGDTRRDKAITQSYSTQSYISQFGASGVDGLLILDGSFPVAGSFDGADIGSYPVVAVSERAETQDIPYVGIDNQLAANDVVHFLFQLGHRNIIHIAGRPGNISARERLEGFRAAMMSLGVAWSDASVEYGDFSIMSGRAAARRILGRHPLPTAIFAANDEMAMGTIHELRTSGLRVPQDISVVGFDDLGFSDVFDPPITSVRQPQLSMGRLGMEMVIERFENGGARLGDTLLPHKLIIRGSTTPPR